MNMDRLMCDLLGYARQVSPKMLECIYDGLENSSAHGWCSENSKPE